jgi:hypothetical protein
VAGDDAERAQVAAAAKALQRPGLSDEERARLAPLLGDGK